MNSTACYTDSSISIYIFFPKHFEMIIRLDAVYSFAYQVLIEDSKGRLIE